MAAAGAVVASTRSIILECEPLPDLGGLALGQGLDQSSHFRASVWVASTRKNDLEIK
jgi:hypothetical protein